MQGNLITGIERHPTEEKIEWIEKVCYAETWYLKDGKRYKQIEYPKIGKHQREVLISLFEKKYSYGAYPRQTGVTSALIWYVVYQIFYAPHSLDIGVNCGNLISSNMFLIGLREQLKYHGIAFDKCSSNYLVVNVGKKKFKVFIINQPEDLRGKRLDMMVYDNAIEKEKQIQLMLSSCCPDCKVASFMTYDALPKISI